MCWLNLWINFNDETVKQDRKEAPYIFHFLEQPKQTTLTYFSFKSWSVGHFIIYHYTFSYTPDAHSTWVIGTPWYTHPVPAALHVTVSDATPSVFPSSPSEITPLPRLICNNLDIGKPLYSDFSQAQCEKMRIQVAKLDWFTTLSMHWAQLELFCVFSLCFFVSSFACPIPLFWSEATIGIIEFAPQCSPWSRRTWVFSWHTIRQCRWRHCGTASQRGWWWGWWLGCGRSGRSLEIMYSSTVLWIVTTNNCCKNLIVTTNNFCKKCESGGSMHLQK